ncbi:tumor necrosis factor-inducible gene 6 protein-like [Ciona intestinalis]
MYGPNLDCWWTIKAPVGMSVALVFTRFETETCCDKLKLYEAESFTESEGLAPFLILSGNTLPDDVYSMHNYLTLNFHSDSTIQKPGYNATYVAITINETDPVIVSPTLSTRTTQTTTTATTTTTTTLFPTPRGNIYMYEKKVLHTFFKN